MILKRKHMGVGKTIQIFVATIICPIYVHFVVLTIYVKGRQGHGRNSLINWLKKKQSRMLLANRHRVYYKGFIETQ